MAIKYAPDWLDLSRDFRPKGPLYKSTDGYKYIQIDSGEKSTTPVIIDGATLQVSSKLYTGDLHISQDGVWILSESTAGSYEWKLLEVNLNLLTDEVGSAIFTTLATTPEA